MPEHQIITLDIERAIDDVTQRKHCDQLQLLYMVDTYGLTTVATWLRNIEADLNGARVVDPRRI